MARSGAEHIDWWIDGCMCREGVAVDYVSYLSRETSDEGGGGGVGLLSVVHRWFFVAGWI